MNTPRTINYAAALKYGAITYIDNFFLFFKIFLACTGLYLIFFLALLLTGIAAWHLHWMNFSPMPLMGGTAYIISPLPTITAITLIIKLILYLLFEYFFYQIIRMGLRLYDGETPAWREFFRINSGEFWDFVSARIWYSLKIILGLMLLIFPVFYFGVTYYFSGFSIVDKRAQSVKEDSLIAYSLASNFWNLFWFACFLTLLSGFMYNLFGLLFAPAIIMARVHAYKQLTSETFKEPRSLEMNSQPEASPVS